MRYQGRDSYELVRAPGQDMLSIEVVLTADCLYDSRKHCEVAPDASVSGSNYFSRKPYSVENEMAPCGQVVLREQGHRA